ncbi:MAG: HlyD family efflux transporter periplasmic adaptor subunit [Planctomycetota bacterium]
MTANAAQTTNQEPAADGGVVRELSALISRLATRAETPSDFVRSASEAIVRAFQSPYGAVSVRLGATVVEDAWHTGGTDPGFWKGPVENIQAETLETARPVAKQFSAKSASLKIGLVSALLRDAGGSMIGVLTIVLRIDDAVPPSTQRDLLEAFAAQISLGLGAIAARNVEAGEPAPTTELSKAAGYRSEVELAFALASSLRNKFGCDQVAIGVSRSSRPAIVSVSGLDEVSARSEAVRLVADAMGEALDRAKTIAVQRGQGEGYRVHRNWHNRCGGMPVATVPLEAGEGCTLFASLRRAGDMPFRDDELSDIAASMSPYAPAFEMLERASRSLRAHARAAARSRLRSLVGRGAWMQKAAVAAALSMTGWVAFGTLPFNLTSSATVVAASQRQISAPHAGALAAVLVAPGDAVEEGQLLALFDTAELRLERQRLVAEIDIATVNEDRALADGISSDAALAQTERRRAKARLSQVDTMIEQASIRAPYDGRIIAGDLRGRVGETVAVGTPLFTVAESSEGWTLEIEVPQRTIGDIGEGMTGEFATDARPESASAMSVERVRPMPEMRVGRSVYIAEAHLPAGDGWLKAGMEGSARVTMGRRPVWWLATHRLVDALRMQFLL